LGLGADGIDNEMSLSHLSNCGLGSCYLPDAEQLHVDGNKSLVYAMVNFTLLPEDQTFRAPGKVGYVFDPTRISHPGSPVTAPPCGGLPQQAPILNQVLSPANNFTFEFVIQGAGDGVCNGGVESMATPENVGGIGPGSLTSLVIEQYQPAEPPAQSDNTRCATAQDNWEEVNRYYNQASTYLQSGQAVHANEPTPGRWRICLTGGLADQIASTGGTVDLDISFSGEQAWDRWNGRHHARARAAAIVDRFHVRARDLETPVRHLSGGNQQRLLVGRETWARPKVLVAMHPTRGLDVDATTAVHAYLHDLRAAGVAIVLISESLDELLAVADRVIVLHRGRIAGDRQAATATREDIGLLMAGGPVA